MPSSSPASLATAGTLGLQEGVNAKDQVFNSYHFSSYVGSDTLVTVVPRFSMQRVSCIGGHYGPFQPNNPVQVPLWLALHLRQTDTCTITPPSYLSASHLTDLVARERRNDVTFEPLPFFFFEVTKNLCELAHEDIPNVAEVLRLVRELQFMRQRKLQQSMSVFEAEGSAMFIPGIRLTNIVSTELHFLRTSFAVVLRQACEMEQKRSQTLIMAPVPAVQPGSVVTRSTAGSTATGGTIERYDGDTQFSALVTTAHGTQSISTIADANTGVVASEFHDSQSMTAGATSTLTIPESSVVSPPIKKRRTLRQT